VSEEGASVSIIQLKVKIARENEEEDVKIYMKRREKKLEEGVAAGTVFGLGF